MRLSEGISFKTCANPCRARLKGGCVTEREGAALSDSTMSLCIAGLAVALSHKSLCEEMSELRAIIACQCNVGAQRSVCHCVVIPVATQMSLPHVCSPPVECCPTGQRASKTSTTRSRNPKCSKTILVKKASCQACYTLMGVPRS